MRLILVFALLLSSIPSQAISWRRGERGRKSDKSGTDATGVDKAPGEVDGVKETAEDLPVDVSAAELASLSGATPIVAGPATEELRPGEAVQGQLRDMVASESASAERGGPAGVSSGRKFDVGAEPKGEGDEVDVDGISPPKVGPQELRWKYDRDVERNIEGSEVFAAARLITGSTWYWDKFQVGGALRIAIGGRTRFVTRIERADTIQIKKMKAKDFAGIYPAKDLKWKRASTLQKKLIEDLKAFGRGAIVTRESRVRLIRFMPSNAAKKLPENQDSSSLAPLLRSGVLIPPALDHLHNFLPKAVLVDLRLYPDGVPYSFVEDMGKLMKAGMQFVFVSDKPLDGPGSLEEQLTKALTPAQMDQLVRYRLAALTDGGNRLSIYEGRYPRSVPFVQFEPIELETMHLVAHQAGASSMRIQSRHEFVATVNPHSSPEALRDAFIAGMAAHGIAPDRFHVELRSKADGSTELVVRRLSMAQGIAAMQETMRREVDVYAFPTQWATMTRDEEIQKAMPQALHATTYFPDLSGPVLIDHFFAAMLDEYRYNLPSDFVASYSKITYLNKKEDSGGGGSESIFSFMGHVMHAAFGWALYEYDRTGNYRGGKLPSFEEALAQAKRIWQREDSRRRKNILEPVAGSMPDYLPTMEARFRNMYEDLGRILKEFPIVFGNEMPVLHIFHRYRDGVLIYRDIFRLVYDGLVGRDTPDGLEVRPIDFKTGAHWTNQHMDKDTQVQLYELVPRRSWKAIPVPFITGEMKKVAIVRAPIFIFPGEIAVATINEWARVKFERFLYTVMRKLRRKSDIEIPSGKKPKVKKGAEEAAETPEKGK